MPIIINLRRLTSLMRRDSPTSQGRGATSTSEYLKSEGFLLIFLFLDNNLHVLASHLDFSNFLVMDIEFFAE